VAPFLLPVEFAARPRAARGRPDERPGPARPGRAAGRRSPVPPFRRRLPRLLARPAARERDIAGRRALSRLLPGRPADRVRRPGAATLFRGDAPRGPAGPDAGGVGLRLRERAPGAALWAAALRRGGAPQGRAARGQPA